MADRKQVTIQYRRLEDVTGAFNGQNLEQAIRSAMAHAHDQGPLSEHWNGRAWLVPPGNEDTLLANLHHDGGNYYFGDLTLYSRGFLQALLTEVEDAPTLDVEQRPAPEGKEYVHSMMYWMAIGNHALLIQSQSLTAKSLEGYLTWFLKERSPTINSDGQVILQSKFDADEVGGDLDDIKEIIVGGIVTGTPTRPAPEQESVARDVQEYRRVAERRGWREKAIEVLRAIMNNEADVMEILNSVPDDASLEVAVHIGYKTRKRRVSRAPMQQALRNLPEGEVMAIGKTGRLTGTDIRLTYPASILRTGSLLDPDDVVRALRGAYTYFIENGKIEA